MHAKRHAEDMTDKTLIATCKLGSLPPAHGWGSI